MNLSDIFCADPFRRCPNWSTLREPQQVTKCPIDRNQPQATGISITSWSPKRSGACSPRTQESVDLTWEGVLNTMWSKSLREERAAEESKQWNVERGARECCQSFRAMATLAVGWGVPQSAATVAPHSALWRHDTRRNAAGRIRSRRLKIAERRANRESKQTEAKDRIMNGREI